MDYRAKAEEIYQAVQARYYIPEARLYRQNYPAQISDGNFCDNWSYGSVLAATLALLRAAPDDYQTAAQVCLAGLERYWQGPGYASFPVGDGSGDRYYDDNEWIGLELLSAYDALQEQRWLDQARDLFDFVLTGWSDNLGGGIYWRERDFSTKNVCSNGPAIVFALRLLQITGEQRYLDWALRIYAWLNARLRSPLGIFWDSVNLWGQIDRSTWTYNTGIMIHANALLYRVTQDRQYLDEARTIARNSLAHFGGSRLGDIPVFPDSPWFNAILFRGYLALQDAGTDQDANAPYADALLRSLDYGWEHARDGDGLLKPDWSGLKPPAEPFRKLLDQAPVAEIYALAGVRAAAAAAAASGVGTAASKADEPAAPATVDMTAAGGPAVLQPAVLRLGAALVSPLGTTGSCHRTTDGFLCDTRHTGPQPVRSQLSGYYEQLGGPTGPLGFPVGPLDITVTSPYGTNGLYQRFEGSKDYPAEIQRALGVRCGASIYWSQAYGPHVTAFEIGSVYERLKGTGGKLGFPVTDRLKIGPSPRGTTGYYQRMEGGTLCWGELRGTFPVWGEVGHCFDRLGGITGLLGFPLTPELAAITSTRFTRGVFQRFEGPAEYPADLKAIVGGGLSCGATIYWSPGAGAHATWGDIGACYERALGTGGRLGFPLSDISDDDGEPGGLRQQFEHGCIVWGLQGGARIVGR